LNEAQAEFQFLNSTRKNQLEKPLRQIDDIKKQVQPEMLEAGLIQVEGEMIENKEEREEKEGEEEQPGHGVSQD